MHSYTKSTYEKNYSEGFWTSHTVLEEIESHAKSRPDDVALVDTNHRLTWRVLQQAIDQLAATLRSQGVERGDIVAVQLPNCVHLVVLVLALLRAGAAYLAVNAAYREHDLSRIFQIARPRLHAFPAAFRNTDYRALSRKAAESLPGPVRQFEIDIDAPLANILMPVLEILPPADPDALFLLGATSGSTGAPKLYAHTHNTQLNEARVLNRMFEVTAKDTFLVCFPMTHRGALMFGLLQAMAAGSKLVILREYNAEAIVNAIQKEKVTSFFVIPTQGYELIQVSRRMNADCSSMRLLMLSGAPVQPELTALVKENWRRCTPITGYGASEGGFSTCTRLDDPPEKLLTCGRAIAGQEICIDPQGRSATGEGEVLVKGAFLFAGYFADQHQTNAAFNGDWFRTGDLGRMEADGSLYITGRLKNTIIRGGLKIQAEEIESVVLQHEDVAEALAIGLPDERVGERVAICIVPRPGRHFDGAALLRHLESQGVTKFKWPEYISVRDSLPRNAVGKQDRVSLRRQAAEVGFERVNA